MQDYGDGHLTKWTFEVAEKEEQPTKPGETDPSEPGIGGEDSPSTRDVSPINWWLLTGLMAGMVLLTAFAGQRRRRQR